MAVAGAIGAIPIFALEILIVEANALVDFAAAEVAATAFALVGWICLALEFAHPEPNDDAALQSVVILGITFVVPLVLGLCLLGMPRCHGISRSATPHSSIFRNRRTDALLTCRRTRILGITL